MGVTAKKILVFGVVQGVGFRYFVQRIADQLGINGWVMNTFEGNVEIIAEGNITVLENFIGRIKDGPRGANVSKLEIEDVKPAFYKSFDIKL